MFPILFEIGDFALHTYGLMIAIGVLLGLYFARSEARRLEINEDRILDVIFYMIVVAIVTSRLFYVATKPAYFFANPLEIVMIWKGGLVFYGGFIGAALTLILYVRAHRLPLGKTLDIAGISIPLGHFFGRLGCFFAGCCYGRPTDVPWAITFTHPDSLAPLGVALHPTQLYHAFGNLLIFLILFFIRRRQHVDGQIFLLYLLFYGVIRSTIEIFRGDDRGGMILGLFSISQVIGISVAFAALVLLIVFFRKKQSAITHG